jgi:energy-coupling factor transporter ATP-binding protein EcfA2
MLGFQADIILADEVLAVGDSHFRHACEQRIRSVGQSGEAVLFVSHDMAAAQRTCSRVVWLDKGRVRHIGPTKETIDAFKTELMAGRLVAPTQQDLAAGCRILDLRLLDVDGAQIGAVQITEPVCIDCVLRVERSDILVVVQLELWRGKVHMLTSTSPAPIRAQKSMTFRASVMFPPDFFNDATYQVRGQLLVQHQSDPAGEQTVASEQVVDVMVMNPQPELSVWADWPWGRPGVISPRLQWRLIPDDSGSTVRREAAVPVPAQGASDRASFGSLWAGSATPLPVVPSKRGPGIPK